MHNYKIACSDYDDYSCFELIHENKFSDEEFYLFVTNAIKNVYDSLSEIEKSYFGTISWLFLDYRFVCEMHKFGFKNLDYVSAIELENVNLSNEDFPICGPEQYFKSEMDKCENCNVSKDICGVKNNDLEIISSEFGAIARKVI